MQILQVNPIEVKSFGNRSCDSYVDHIIIGKCSNNIYYLSNLTFAPINIKNNEMIINATLKMYCKKTCKPYTRLNICINENNIVQSIGNKGGYEWDISSIIKYGDKTDLKLCIYTNERINGCVLKEFEALESIKQPTLHLIVDDILPKTKSRLYNIVKEYLSSGIQKQSNWIDCVSFYKYYYFIQNSGVQSVQVFIEISPDKNITFQDSGPFEVKSNKTLYLQPMRESHFVRITFINLEGNELNSIRVWFQGK